MTKQIHSMRSLPGLFEDSKNDISFAFGRLIFPRKPKGVEVHGDSVGERFDCETGLSIHRRDGVNDECSGQMGESGKVCSASATAFRETRERKCLNTTTIS